MPPSLASWMGADNRRPASVSGTNSVSSGIGRCCESVLGEGKRRLHYSPLLEAKSESDAHEDSAVASEFVDRDFANPRT